MKKNNNLKPLAIILSFCLFLSILGMASIKTNPVVAQAEGYQTPTPDAQGVIYYEVQLGEFCENIKDKTGVPVAEIIRLNNLDEKCAIFAGQKIIIGIVTAPTQPPTQPPAQGTTPVAPVQVTPPPASVEPTATAVLGVGKVCIVLFHDKDGNGNRTQGENYLFGGEVSINDRAGTVSRVGTTVAGNPDSINPLCFEELPPGDYNISIAMPPDFNPTTVTNYAVTVVAGDSMTVDFGAQEAVPEKATVEADTGKRSPLLAILGGVILLSGLGLLFYMIRSRKG